MATTSRGATKSRPKAPAPAPASASAPAPADGPRLSDADLTAVLALISDADSVELKVTVPTDAQRATVQGLPLDPVEAQPRQIFFFDTEDLALNRAGVVVRARRIQGGRADTVIKLRPVVPDQLPAALRRQADFNVEVDVLPGGFVCSASFKGRATGEDVRSAVAGKLPLRRLFSKSQREFYRAHAPEGLTLESLMPLGPTFILKERFPIRSGTGKLAVERQLVAEMWLYPDGTRIFELSTKCLPAEALKVAADTKAYLAERGIFIGGAQQTKTRTALEYYAAQLAAHRAGTGQAAAAGDGSAAG